GGHRGRNRDVEIAIDANCKCGQRRRGQRRAVVGDAHGVLTDGHAVRGEASRETAVCGGGTDLELAKSQRREGNATGKGSTAIGCNCQDAHRRTGGGYNLAENTATDRSGNRDAVLSEANG